jgi:Zn-dependent M28 family amino/carboxypeptidase
MKKLLGLAAGLLFTAMSFAQSNVVFTDASATYDKATTTSFNFIFSPAYAADDIKSNASYYTSYFTLTLEEAGTAGYKVNIKLVEDNEMARRVILRLFTSLDVKEINAGGTQIERDEFVEKYIIK